MSIAENKKAGQKPGAKRVAQQARTNPVIKETAGQKPGSGDNHSNTQHQAFDKDKRPGIFISYNMADDINLLQIIDVVRTGIAYNDFTKLVDYTPFTMAEWASYLQLSMRTMQRNQKERKPFQPVQSERIVELSMLYQYGVEVFGDQNNFDIWLHTKSVALGGSAPKELLDTKFGIGMVKDALTRIEHGVFA
jgi:putative toxin-antitoxin system antitoxin component (TIGR02293 family)